MKNNIKHWRNTAIIFGIISGLMLTSYPHRDARAEALPTPALPEVSDPYPGDPRLEPLPSQPIKLVNFNVFTTSPGRDGLFGTTDDIQHVLTMRFPPRVNGQTASDGDGHSDLYILFNEATGLPIEQPPIVEAVPNGATGPGATVPDGTARLFSAVWELHAVTVDPLYDPADPATLIDSAQKVTGPGASPYVKKIFQTNIFLNCPLVPAGTVLDPIPHGPVPSQPRVQDAFFEGQIVHFVPYDIEDGPANPQVMFKFEDPNGVTLPRPDAPHLVASRGPGDPFYTPIWEIWTVHVPSGFDVTKLKSKDIINKSGFPITSSGIRLNCPVVAVDGEPVPFDDTLDLLERVTAAARGFGDNFLPVDIAGVRHAKDRRQFLTKPRTHVITEVDLPIFTTAAAGAGTTSDFPPIDPAKKGNIIPLILKDPLQLQSSGPTTTGDIIRINQAELDAAYADNDPPLLPADLEANFTQLIGAGLLAPEWAPGGGHSYQERLALVGQALFELVFKPEQGANSKDVTRCSACHSTPASGGAARALYTLEAGNILIPGLPEFGRVTTLNPGSMWGSGGAQVLRDQLVTLGGAVPCTTPGVNKPPGCTTFAHGSRGTVATMRAVAGGAFNTHVGVQSAEFIVGQQAAAKAKGCDTNGNGQVDLTEAANCDLDGDGVKNEMTVGEVTAVTVFFMNLPVPSPIPQDTQDPGLLDLLSALGITQDSINRGKDLFTHSIDQGGAACATCHTPFRPFLASPAFNLTNPETNSVLPLQVASHPAEQSEVQAGLAASVGQPGLRINGDFKLHKMGSKMFCSGTDLIKTAELWDVGSVFPYMRCGTFGSDLSAAIRAHRGVSLDTLSVTRANPVNFLDASGNKMTSQSITITNISSVVTIVASSTKPIRVVLIGDKMSPGIQAATAAGTAPDGGRRQGAFWLVTTNLAAGASQTLNLVFENPSWGPLSYDLAIQDDAGYSEAVASAQAFKKLDNPTDLINFLRVQLIGAKVGEGSGGINQ